MGCRCHDRKLPNPSTLTLVSVNQKRMVYLHVSGYVNKENENIAKIFNALGIKYKTIQDYPRKNRHYPYTTIEEQIVCVLNIIAIYRKNEL